MSFRRSEKAAIQAGATRLLYRNASIVLITSLFNGLLVVFLFWDLAARQGLMIWYGAIAAMSLARAWSVGRYRESDPPARQLYWARLFALGAAVSGVIWGSTVYFIDAHLDTLPAQIMILILAGMTAGAVAASAAYLPATLLFNVLAVLPVSAYFLASGVAEYVIMGVILIFYLLLMSQLARNINTMIAQRMIAEERLRQMSHEQDLLLDNVQIGMAFIKWRHAVRANAYMEKLFGMRAGEWKGMKTATVMPSEADDRELAAEARPVMAEGRSFVTERLLKRRDGTLFWGRMVGMAIDPEAVEEGSIWLIEDIGERKQAEAQVIQASKLATLGEMAASVAHELSQPLNVIRMAAGNLLRRQEQGRLESDYVRDKLRRIDKQTERAAAIIDHMRLFGRKADERPAKLDVREAVTGATDLMGEQLRLGEIEVKVSLPEHCRRVLGHRVRMEQVVLNLLTNARDAIQGAGGGKADDRWISIVVKENEAGEVTISVEDSGPGIPPRVLDRIFEPFYTTKEMGEGTGLGLSVSFGIVRDMGGRIEAANGGAGARFTISLPGLP